MRVCTVDGGELSASCSDCFTHRETVLSTYSVGGWLGLHYQFGDYLHLGLCPVLPACSWTMLYWLKFINVLAFADH